MRRPTAGFSGTALLSLSRSRMANSVQTKEHMDAEDIFVTDKTLAEDKMHDIATRAGRFADMVNSRHDSEKASFMATLGAVGHHHHHNRAPSKSTNRSHSSLDHGEKELLHL